MVIIVGVKKRFSVLNWFGVKPESYPRISAGAFKFSSAQTYPKPIKSELLKVRPRHWYILRTSPAILTSYLHRILKLSDRNNGLY